MVITIYYCKPTILLSIILYIYINMYHGGFHKLGTPKWMVYKRKSHLEMDDDWGYLYFRKPPYGNDMLDILILSDITK